MNEMNAQQLNMSGHSAFRLFYHVIFTTKYRRKVIHVEMLKRLEAIFRETLEKWRCRLVEFGGEADHVHLLIDAHPALDLSQMIGNLKAVSARRIRREFAQHVRRYYWKPFFWNSAYAVISVGGRASIETLLRYIQEQQEPPGARAAPPLD